MVEKVANDHSVSMTACDKRSDYTKTMNIIQDELASLRRACIRTHTSILRHGRMHGRMDERIYTANTYVSYDTCMHDPHDGQPENMQHPVSLGSFASSCIWSLQLYIMNCRSTPGQAFKVHCSAIAPEATVATAPDARACAPCVERTSVKAGG